jgi:transcriptional regulator with XRE-family HTH domain
MREKQEFSERLRAAMRARGLEPTAPVLEREFNARWLGKSVARQTVWKWLTGQAIPTQDKLQELAKWLRVEPQILRFGDHALRHVRAQEKRWDEGAGYAERETFDTFLQLTAGQRRVVKEVILAFAKNNRPP